MANREVNAQAEMQHIDMHDIKGLKRLIRTGACVGGIGAAVGLGVAAMVGYHLLIRPDMYDMVVGGCIILPASVYVSYFGVRNLIRAREAMGAVRFSELNRMQSDIHGTG
jgi:hypothetical protein